MRNVCKKKSVATVKSIKNQSLSSDTITPLLSSATSHRLYACTAVHGLHLLVCTIISIQYYHPRGTFVPHLLYAFTLFSLSCRYAAATGPG